MDFLRQFIMTAIRDMINNNVALYQTYQYASGWFSKGVLTQEDLEEIDKLYKDKEQVKEEQQVVEEVSSEIEQPIEEKISENEIVENTATEVAEGE